MNKIQALFSGRQPTAPDDQWPSALHFPATFKHKASPVKRLEALSRPIEDFFQDRLAVHAVLTPSARAGIALILRAHGFNRAHAVFVPKWSSHCLWDVVGRCANPTISMNPEPQAIIAAHKWGRTSKLSKPFPALVIEDSVDTLFKNANSLFPNDGLYEVLSLPKILGTYCGGIVLTRDSAAAARLRALRRNGATPGAGETNSKLADLPGHQSYLKFVSAQAYRSGWTAFMEWEYHEYRNVFLDENGLAHVRTCLKNYARNSAVVERRLKFALRQNKRLAKYVDLSSGRLPPLLAVPCKGAGMSSRDSPLSIRHCDFKRSVDRPLYEPACLLPLHFGVSEETFRSRLKALSGL